MMGATALYRANKRDCDACELKPQCCLKMPARRVLRSITNGPRHCARNRQDQDLSQVPARLGRLRPFAASRLPDFELRTLNRAAQASQTARPAKQ